MNQTKYKNHLDVKFLFNQQQQYKKKMNENDEDDEK
jgi:hypothetical protein